jgi:hypothetical protein
VGNLFWRDGLSPQRSHLGANLTEFLSGLAHG